MLRKKISRLIVGIMTGLMLLTGASNYGQVVFSKTNNNSTLTPMGKTETIDTRSQDSSEKFLNAIKKSDVSIIKLTNVVGTNEFVLNEEIIKALNSRTRELKIILEKGIILTIENIKSDLVLDGKNKLEIARGENHTEHMLQVKDGVNKNITIQNVIFENLETGVVFRNLNKNKNVKVTLKGNTLKEYFEEEEATEEGGFQDSVRVDIDSSFAEDTNNTIFTENMINNNFLYVDQKSNIKFSQDSDVLNGYTVADFIGKLESTTDDDFIREIYGEGVIAVYSEDFIESEEWDEEEKKLPTLPSNVFVGEDGMFSFRTEKLIPGTEYITVTSLYTGFEDKYKNQYKRIFGTYGYFKTFDVTVKNKTDKSVTFEIPYDEILNYPLEFVVKGKNFEKKFTRFNTELELNDLSPNTKYTYELKDINGGVITKGEFTTENEGNNNENSSVSYVDITTGDMGRATITDNYASIPVSNAGVFNSLKNGRYHATNFEGIDLKIGDGKIELTGLVPNKEYKNLTITYTDKDSKLRTIRIPAFKTKDGATKFKRFIISVYKNSLNRLPDETGYVYWEKELKNKRITPAKFVKNLLNEVEFNLINITVEEKIEGMYKVIVDREADSEGLNYWTKKYNDLVKKGFDNSKALNSVAEEMVNEREFKNRVDGLGI